MMKILGKNSNLHDSIIWAIRFDDELFFDLDYLISSYIDDDGYNQNTLIPITIKFNNVERLNISISSDWINGMEIDSLMIDSVDKSFNIQFNLQEGCINFCSSDYNIFVKGDAIISQNSCLTEEERGGYNFDIK